MRTPFKKIRNNARFRDYRTLVVIVAGLLAGVSMPASAEKITDAEYQYDELGRIVRADYADGGSVRYEYDELGNRVKVSVSAGIVVVPLNGFTVIPIAKG